MSTEAQFHEGQVVWYSTLIVNQIVPGLPFGGVGNSGISVEVVSPGHSAHEIAHAVIDCKGARLVEVRYAIAGGSTTSMNGCWNRRPCQ